MNELAIRSCMAGQVLQWRKTQWWVGPEYSIQGASYRTLRHRLRWACGRQTRSKQRRSRRVRAACVSDRSGALVTLGGSALRLTSRHGRATGAIDLATVTGAGNQHRR
jgi:hypothetical protein